MIRFCLLFVFTLTSYSVGIAQQANTVCYGGRCYQVAPPSTIRYPIVSPPPVIYQPQIQYRPYQYQGSVYQPREYRTPFRNWLFGTGHINHYYSPAANQQ